MRPAFMDLAALRLGRSQTKMTIVRIKTKAATREPITTAVLPRPEKCERDCGLRQTGDMMLGSGLSDVDWGRVIYRIS